MTSRGVGSSKITTASTHSSAARISARSRSGKTGRPAPFNRRTLASLLRPTISASPRARACSRLPMCPGCSKSKAAVREYDAAAVAFPWAKPQNRFVESQNLRVQRNSMKSHVKIALALGERASLSRTGGAALSRLSPLMKPLMKMDKTLRAVIGVGLCVLGLSLGLAVPYQSHTFRIDAGGCRLVTDIVEPAGQPAGGHATGIRCSFSWSIGEQTDHVVHHCGIRFARFARFCAGSARARTNRRPILLRTLR